MTASLKIVIDKDAPLCGFAGEIYRLMTQHWVVHQIFFDAKLIIYFNKSLRKLISVFNKSQSKYFNVEPRRQRLSLNKANINVVKQ